MKEQDFEERMTNQPGATWKVFAMVRLLTFEVSGLPLAAGPLDRKVSCCAHEQPHSANAA